MANKEIKHTIRLEGEKEYSAAIKDAQRNLRTLRSELKAETAELGANATAQQKNEARAKSLKAQIAEQEKVVETLRKALAEAKRDYGDNEDVVQKWEQKLNAARTTLANMQNGLAETENAMRGVSGATAEGVTATKSFADALNSVASVGESVSSAIEDIFTGLISTVSDAVEQLWDLISETAAKANNWTDIAGYWNTDPANIEKWARAIEASGNSFEDLETIVTRLVLGGKGKDIAEMLGVSDVNYEDQWAYAMDVLNRIYQLKSEGNLPDNLWETLFGEKKATKAMDIINDWEDVQKGLTTYNADEGGYGLGSEALETMNDLYVQISDVEGRWQALKEKFAGEFGHLTADLLVNVSGSLDALNMFLNAEDEEDREKALEQLRANIEEFFQKVAAAIKAGLETIGKVGESLQGSDDPIVSAIGDLLVTIRDVGTWLIAHDEEVKLALEAIFGAWLLGLLTKVSAQLATIIAQIMVIKRFKSWASAEVIAEGASGVGAAGAGAGGGAAASAGGGFWATLGSAAAPIVGGLAGGVLGSAIYLPLANYLQKKHYQETWGEYNANEDINELRRAEVRGENDAETARLQAMLDQMFYAVSGDVKMALGSDMTADIKDAFRQNANEYLAMTPNSDFWEWASQFADLSNGLDEEEVEAIINGIYLGDAWQEFGIDVANAVSDKIDTILGGGTEQNNQNGLTSDDLGVFRGLPGMLRQALFSQISGMKVVMDGEVVGRVVTPYVGGGLYKMVTE